MNHTCDTLRNDLDNGDECVHCGATYMDPEIRRTYAAPVASAPAPVKAQRVIDSARKPWLARGWFHNVQMAGASGGLDTRARRR